MNPYGWTSEGGLNYYYSQVFVAKTRNLWAYVIRDSPDVTV